MEKRNSRPAKTPRLFLFFRNRRKSRSSRSNGGLAAGRFGVTELSAAPVRASP